METTALLRKRTFRVCNAGGQLTTLNGRFRISAQGQHCHKAAVLLVASDAALYLATANFVAGAVSKVDGGYTQER